jgi:hypothetical protein
MSGIAVRAENEHREPEAISPEFPALSEDTKEILRRVHSLRSHPSPGSLRLGEMTHDKPLELRLFDALASAKILTSQVAMHLDQNWRSKLFHQIDSLHDPAEWELGDEPLREASFSTFLKAILNIKPGRRPGLGLSSEGNLIAAWTYDSDRLTIEFLPSDRVRWVLSRRAEGDTERFAGETRVGRLFEGLKSFNPEHWFGDVAKNQEPSG